MPWIIGGATLLLLCLYWLYRWLSDRDSSHEDRLPSFPSDDDQSSDSGDSSELARYYQEKADRELAAKQQKVKEIAQASPILSSELQKQAGLAHNSVDLSEQDDERIREIARSVPDDMLNMLHVAAVQQEINFDLRSEVDRQAVEYPTQDIEPEQMAEIGQLPEVLPEQQMLQGPAFYSALAQNELTVLRSYEEVAKRKQLYVLEDLSGSMDSLMENGLPRYVWAHGISLNLALQALKGEAVFARREFDGRPHELIEVKGPEDAEVLINRVLRSQTTRGGTDIYAALNRAAIDIRSSGSG